MKILGIIPARGGSKGVPGKNIKLLGKHPLIYYTIERALEAKGIDQLMLNTDDPKIAEVGKELGVEVPFLRPKRLAEDATPTLPVIQYTLNWFLDNGIQYDAVCLLQPTNPFRPKGFIDEAITKFKQKEMDALISVLEVPHEYNPHWVFEPDPEGKLKIATGENTLVPRRQELPKAYFRDGSIYLTKAEVILNENSLYGQKLGYILADKNHYVNIDTMKDWEKAENKLTDLACVE
ncbi:cytidylyltransferase domain-containing protein [Flexithrix dorotheae]|uniref:acylneuraminate cytidylyltransferase family protein n=1 Tax=Flexithrix dorotheae TaxID=70993 RepID=UPI000367CF56|nr:acylneuraminate cytidylyltransferase family protein [Flexithrix dorotheae]